jgi:pimeloyl-ACP methyl ester carboxylesterase
MTDMTTAKSNGIELCYETFGSSDDPALLLVMGLGAQMIAWPDTFCEALASRGFHVIRYDNRDVGLSTKLEGQTYSLDDMADDAAGLLDALGIGAAHVVGASMGGMISQVLAIRHPAKVLTLTSIMSSAGGEDAAPPSPEAMAVLMAQRPETRDDVIEMAVQARRVIGGKGWPIDEAKTRADAARAYDRMYYPEGFLRQITAIMSAPSRVAALGELTMPVLVIHGTDDTLVPPDNGRITAKAVPHAELIEIEGMGHDLPEPVVPQLVEAIVKHASTPA